MKRVLCTVLALVPLLSSAAAHAACSGSGIAWLCPAGASISDVQAAINSASDGAVITFAAGSYTWGSEASFSNSAGATLACTSVGACTVSVTAGAVLGITSLSAGTNSKLYRISGFTFNQSTNHFVLWFGSNCPCTGDNVYTQIRIDHNTFNLAAGSVAVFFGENSTISSFYGVIDHNTVSSASSVSLLNMIGATNNSPPPSPLGTANNMFVENNTITITTMTNAGDSCMDVWGGHAIVWRHNTSLNCLIAAHGVTHSGGPQNIELYDNSLSVNSGSVGQSEQDGYRLFHHQGSGEFIAFNNSFTAYSGKNSEVISMLHYCDYVNCIDSSPGATQCNGTEARDGNRLPMTTNRGYPCWRQPGRDFAGNYVPMYVWNNYWSDTLAQIPLVAPDEGGSPDYYSNHMQANREWYNAVSAAAQTSSSSPFNGTTGMGFGTLANRPTTCTTNATESGAGVGYFATDVGAQGTLYTCSSTNTWTVFYTPYTYPHPLVTGGQTSPPAAPTKPAAVAH